MASAPGRFTIVYNGEVYNFQEIRRELECLPEKQAPWRGHSDTEVLLAAVEAWGIEGALQRCNGMFAFAVWDALEGQLTLARDRLGEKPLYFGWIAGRFAFASEMSALAAVPGWNPKLCESQVAAYLQCGYVRGYSSAISGIFRLPPGNILRLDLKDLSTPLSPAEHSSRCSAYWSVGTAASTGSGDPFTGDVKQAGDELEQLLGHAIAIRKVADVPLGAFLSGGIDSSLVAALMQSTSSKPIQTFCIGFLEQGYDEAPFARMVAKRIGSDHSELYVSGQDALDVIPRLPKIYDEPFADQSAIPTFLVSQLARKTVTVTLSGDGGDELFGGYGRYQTIPKLWACLRPFGKGGRAFFARALRRTAQVADWALPPASADKPHVSFRLDRLSERVRAATLEDMRLAYIGGAGSAALSSHELAPANGLSGSANRMDTLRRLMYSDQVDYLPDNILVKLDRASMAVSLESRVPFLDHRIVEFSWRLPPHLLRHGGRGKLVLREVLARHIEPAIFERPKQGFAPPVSLWLRGPLREWADSLLSQDSLAHLPVVDSSHVRKLWQGHLERKLDAGYALWSVLMLSAWREQHGASVA